MAVKVRRDMELANGSGIRRQSTTSRQNAVGSAPGLDIGPETNEPLWDGSRLDYDVAVSGLMAG